MKKNINFFKAVFRNIEIRCNNANSPSYRFYGLKGIKNYLTVNDLIFIWHRDNADNLKRPSIDRIDPRSHYTIENCRFIELIENIQNAHPKKILPPKIGIIKKQAFICGWSGCENKPVDGKMKCQFHLDYAKNRKSNPGKIYKGDNSYSRVTKYCRRDNDGVING